jgi:hypothetical protein
MCKETEQLKLLFYALPQLVKRMQEAKEKAQSTANSTSYPELIFELEAAVDFINEHWNQTFQQINKLQDYCMNFEHLWTIFEPGILLYTADSFGEGRIYRLLNSGYREMPDRSVTFQLTTAHVDCDQQYVGLVFDPQVISIAEFKDAISIFRLKAFPFKMLPNYAEERERLIERAEKALTLIGRKLQEYTGHALDEKGKKFNSHGRVMLDPAAYRKFCPNGGLLASVTTPIKVDQLTPDQKLMFTSVLYGFSLGDKIWG